MSFQKLALSNVNMIADFLSKTFTEEPDQEEFDPCSVHDEELKALLVSLVEDIFQLVATLAAEQSREVVERLEETREMVMLVVRKAVLVYPTVLAVRLVTRLLPFWLRTVTTSAMASTGILMEIIAAVKTINNNKNYHSDLAFQLDKIKEKNKTTKLSEQIRRKFRR